MSTPMTPDRLRQIAEVFESALELEESLRGPYLAALARSDFDLVRRVHALLEARGEPTGNEAGDAVSRDESPGVTSVETPRVESAAGGDAGSDAGDGEIRQIGPYRVVDWLGMGGMGTVYLAERSDDEFERRVAIKVIRLGFDVPEVKRRFLSERQILATFDHPNIAKMYEGGTTPDGSPYLVMEYIEGQPIDRYCDENRLTVKERLGLFRQVCAAVDYAHRNLVVHRDLKPSNVLVTAEGIPKLLDFGIAKLLDPEQFPITVEATETGHGPLTPNYASPEQIAAERVTTLSDVYSLGVLLYKLLTGRLPFDRRLRSREILAKEAALQEPTRPSLAVGTVNGGVSETGAGGETTGDSSLWSAEPAQHRRQLQGDLDNIVLTALRSEADRRYGSVQLLDEDLERHLDGLPVRARQASGFYRAGKFIRRHRLPVSAAAIFLILILGFLLHTVRQNEVIREARDSAITQEQRAETVAEFFVDLFAELSPEQARGKELTSREILDKASDRLLSDQSGDPAVRVSLLTNLGNIHLDFKDQERAGDLLKLAYEEGQAIGGKGLALATMGYANYVADNVGREEGFYIGEEAIDLFERLSARAELARALASMSLWAPKSSQGVVLAERAVAVAKESGELEPLSLAYNNLAIAKGTRDLPAATAAMEEALRIGRIIDSEDSPTLMQRIGNMAYLYQVQGRLQEAGELNREALEKAERVLGEDAPHMGIRHNNMAQYANLVGDYKAAEKHGRKALAIWTEAYGAEGRSNWYPLSNICFALLNMNRAAEALVSCDRAVALLDGLGEPGLPARIGRCRVIRRLAGPSEARACFDETMALFESLEENSRFSYIYLPAAWLEFGKLDLTAGKTEAAAESFRRSLESSQTVAESKSVHNAGTRLMAKIYLNRIDEISEELDFLSKSGARFRSMELYCLEAGNPPVCDSLEALFPTDPWPGTEGAS